MAQIRKVESQIEIKSHADKFFETWVHKLQQISKMCPDKIFKMELNEGEWGNVGSVNTWHYDGYGKPEFITTKIAEVDEKNKTMRYDYVDGHILRNYYSSFESKLQVTPKGENSIVKWTIHYEKRNEDAPDADIYVDYLLNCGKDVDAYICRA